MSAALFFNTYKPLIFCCASALKVFLPPPKANKATIKNPQANSCNGKRKRLLLNRPCQLPVTQEDVSKRGEMKANSRCPRAADLGGGGRQQPFELNQQRSLFH